MKYYLISILLLLIISNGSGQQEINNDQKVLIIVNPTLTKLINIKFLTDNKYLNVPHLKIIALYNLKEKYDFSRCEEFIKNNKLDFIELRGLNLNIDYDSLFHKSSLTPVFYKLFKESDGILFMGGDDIPPLIYHEKTNFQTEILPYERMYELSFMFHLIGGSQDKSFGPFLDERPGYLVMGICLGMQIMNVSSGGDMYQDIPSEIYHMNNYEEIVNQPIENQHRNYWGNISNKDEYAFCTFHHLLVNPKSFFVTGMNLKLPVKALVLSAHHQCIKNLGMNLSVAATSIDGKVIEAVEHTKYPNVFGIQFHPEFKFIYDDSNKTIVNGNSNQRSTDIISDEDKLFNKNIWEYLSRLLNSDSKK